MSPTPARFCVVANMAAAHTDPGNAAGSGSGNNAIAAAFARLEAGKSRSLWLPKLGLGDADVGALVAALRDPRRREVVLGLQKLHLGGKGGLAVLKGW